MAKTQTYTTFGGTSGAIRDIGGARANANVEGAVGRAARAFITEWEAEQKRKKELNSLNYGVDINDYVTEGPNGTYRYSIDKDAYRKAQLRWMSGNTAFQGWTEEDMNNFLDQTQGLSKKEREAARLWTSAGIGQRNANEQKARDREDMLAEIEAYKAGFSNESIQTAIAAERQAWDAKIQSTLQQAMNQAAAQGRVMDGSTYAMLRGRLEAQAAAAVQKVQSDYEQKRMEYALNAMQMKNDVYKNTNNVVMDYNDVANILKAMAGQK